MPPPFTLTREAIQGGLVQKMAAALAEQGGIRLLSEAELTASRAAVLAEADLAGGVWLFAYGSLIWNPAFHFVDRQTGTLFGHHRRFCLWTNLGRGSPERPGLMLGLERGGCCRGVAYRIAPEAVESELAIIWRREMLSGAYRPAWLRVRLATGVVPALGFVVNHRHERYAGRLGDDQVATVLASAEGVLGRGAAYLNDTAAHLAEIGIADPYLARLCRLVALAPRPAEPAPVTPSATSADGR